MKKLNVLIVVFWVFALATLQAEEMWENDLVLRSSKDIEWNNCSVGAADGSILYAWTDSHEGNKNVYAQLVNAAGNPVWTEPVAMTTELHDQRDPVVIATTDNCFVIIWNDPRLGSSSDLFAQKLNISGQKLWTEDGVAVCTAPTYQSDVKVAKDNNGGLYFAWTDYRSEGVNTYIQHLDGNGNALWQADGQVADTSAQCVLNDMTADGQNGILIAYERCTNEENSILVRKLDAAGDDVWPTPLLIGFHTQTDFMGGCHLSATGTNSFVAAWQYSLNYGVVNIHAQLFDNNKQPLWANPITVGSAAGCEYDLNSIAYDSNGIFFCFDLFADYGYTTMMQKMNMQGELLWNEASTICEQTRLYMQTYKSRIVGDMNGGCYLAWEDMFDYGDPNRDVSIQHFSASSAKLWGEQGLLLYDDERVQAKPVVNLTSGGIFVGWMDYRDAIGSIRYQKLTPVGIAQLEAGGRMLINGLNGMQFPTRYSFERGDDVLIVWEDDRDGRSPLSGIYMQAVNTDGTLDFPVNGLQILSADAGFDRLLGAYMTQAGELAVIWIEYETDAQCIYMQMVSEDGIPLWGDNGVRVAISNASWIDSASISASGPDIYVGWSSRYALDSYLIQRVWGQRVSQGEQQWGDEGCMLHYISPSNFHIQQLLQGVEGNCFIWNEVTTGNPTQLRAKLFAPDGSASPGWQQVGNIIYSGTNLYEASVKKWGNNWLILWNQMASMTSFLTYAQLVNDAGTMLWGAQDGRLLNEGVIYHYQYDCAVDNNNFVVLYRSGNQLQAKAYNTQADELWSSGIVTSALNFTDTFRICKMLNGSYTVIWEASFPGRDIGNALMYTYMSSQGELYNNTGYTLTNDSYGCYFPLISVIGNDSYVSWSQGYTNSDEDWDFYDIRMQKLNSPYVGNEDETTVCSALISDFAISPNPFRQPVTLNWKMKSNAEIDVTIYNVRGQKVKTLYHGVCNKGTQHLKWDASNDAGRTCASGVYFCRITTKESVISKKMLMMK